MTKDVFERIECIMECVKEPCCRSINYKKTFQNEPKCEMLHEVIYNTSEKALKRNSSYDYVYLLDPQKVWIVCRVESLVGRLRKALELLIGKYEKIKPACVPYRIVQELFW